MPLRLAQRNQAYLSNQRGSAVVETSLSMTVVATVIVGGMSILYFSFTRVWLNHSSYEGLICLSTRAAQGECEARFRNDTANAIPIGRVSELHMTRSKHQAKIDVRFSYGQQTVLSVHDSLNLPLRGPIKKGEEFL